MSKNKTSSYLSDGPKSWYYRDSKANPFQYQNHFPSALGWIHYGRERGVCRILTKVQNTIWPQTHYVPRGGSSSNTNGLARTGFSLVCHRLDCLARLFFAPDVEQKKGRLNYSSTDHILFYLDRSNFVISKHKYIVITILFYSAECVIQIGEG